jgi:polyisoprenoid-binding protein YceI
MAKRRLLQTAALLAIVFAAGKLTPAQETTLVVDPAKTTVSFALEATLHTVHGTFRLKGGVIQFNSATGAASGAVTVDATSGETGNGRRDRNMHKDVLQSARYPEIAFTPTRVTGSLVAQGESNVTVDGVLRLRGVDHAITLPFKVQTSDGELRATTQFTVPYVAWGLKNPSSFWLRVAEKVGVSIAAEGKLTSAAAQR